MVDLQIETKKKEWTGCLNKSGGKPDRCSKIERDLRATSKVAGIDCCIDETIALMRCTGNAARASGCSAEFLAMRECNRIGGRQITSDSDGCRIHAGQSNYFVPGAPFLVSSAPPKRSLVGMRESGQEYAQELGISADMVAF